MPGFIDFSQNTHMITTNHSTFCTSIYPRVKHDGSFVSEYWCIAQTIFLPHPRKCDVVSPLLMAWKIGNVISGRSKIGAGIEKSFTHRCFLTICSLGKENNSFFVLVQVMLWDLSVAIPNPGPWTCTATLMCDRFQAVFRVVIPYGINTINH